MAMGLDPSGACLHCVWGETEGFTRDVHELLGKFLVAKKFLFRNYISLVIYELEIFRVL